MDTETLKLDQFIDQDGYDEKGKRKRPIDFSYLPSWLRDPEPITERKEAKGASDAI